MMLYVTSLQPFAGKTLTVLGLGRFLASKKKLGYLKTLGNRPVIQEGVLTDQDALSVAQALQLDIPPQDLCALVITQDVVIEALERGPQDLKERIHRKLALYRDRFLLLSGYGTLYSGKFLGNSHLDLIKALGAKTVLTVRWEGEYLLDPLLKAREDLGEALSGIVINALREETRSFYEDLIRPYLEKEGFLILGEIPYEPFLEAVSVGELRNFIGGDLLVPGREEQLVEHFLIGGMQVDRAITYFRKTPRFGVIVGGDRSDIQLAALETGAVCLILTGGLYPNEIILSRAEESGVAILVVPDDTYSAARKVEQLPRLTRLRHPAKLQRAFQLLDQHLYYERLKSLLSL
ncbi:phosphotransacetylase family protein [Thermosulfurimonas marina]|uniref:Phosphotransacetylase family protein n=1 Tax=Thermosulfurimonas marina TaxID=2047767 RepID=A0A6H1WQ63_9BACT|nr:DRTGG domain-containing protein [Thermosulfurimonas marina]QJA05276.1 phosphotransacetylase family protein [Thermosulfurimonas marina]